MIGKNYKPIAHELCSFDNGIMCWVTVMWTLDLPVDLLKMIMASPCLSCDCDIHSTNPLTSHRECLPFTPFYHSLKSPITKLRHHLCTLRKRMCGLRACGSQIRVEKLRWSCTSAEKDPREHDEFCPIIIDNNNPPKNHITKYIYYL